MSTLSRRGLLGGAAAGSLTLIAAPATATATPSGPRRWSTSWATAQTAPTASDADATTGFTDTTIRQVLRLSAGGPIRLRFANPFGTTPVTVGPVTAGRHPVLFSGEKQVLIATGATVISDPVDLHVPDHGDLVVSIYLPGPTGPLSFHRNVHATGLIGAGDLTGAGNSAYQRQTKSVFLLTGVDVTSRDQRTLAILGDSITEGVGTPDDTNLRWPDQFAALFRKAPAVANLGISGNRLLLDDGRFGPGGQARFDRDVLALPGLDAVLVFLGINDIQQPPSQLDPAVLLAAYGQLARRARDQELKVLGATIGPFRGWIRYTDELEMVRQQVNAGLRTGGIFDTLVDVDAALRDPADPARLRPDFTSGDGLHPNAAGARAIALCVGKEFDA
ncbi:lysophospholipase L1-like esterase [Kribbella steppae]|uniref:Lysophospholipase L1-like esterase n=1 Tax=Kribbella steppae TaxID=2512223 RepID=A0A4R2H5T1_9ACTN|nr:GDSL-type esterase/lipase family protein [Kribbella steppae]TCO21370.1 lysophospholipase L1-like esterase [Kribbella steppae]